MPYSLSSFGPVADIRARSVLRDPFRDVLIPTVPKLPLIESSKHPQYTLSLWLAEMGF